MWNADTAYSTVRSPACLAWLGFLWLVVRTWAARNDGWLEYILCRVPHPPQLHTSKLPMQASFAAMTGLVVSTPFRELVNTLGGRLLRGQLADATSSAVSVAVVPLIDTLTVAVQKDESAKREVKVTKYTWEDDGSFIRVSAQSPGRSEASLQCSDPPLTALRPHCSALRPSLAARRPHCSALSPP